MAVKVGKIVVEFAMDYTNPPIEDKIEMISSGVPSVDKIKEVVKEKRPKYSEYMHSFRYIRFYHKT
jgi:hypothetical protein